MGQLHPNRHRPLPADCSSRRRAAGAAGAQRRDGGEQPLGAQRQGAEEAVRRYGDGTGRERGRVRLRPGLGGNQERENAQNARGAQKNEGEAAEQQAERNAGVKSPAKDCLFINTVYIFLVM